jgi:hypothetical protein
MFHSVDLALLIFFQTSPWVLCVFILFGHYLMFCGNPCRLMLQSQSPLCILLMNLTQRRLSSWFKDCKNKTLMFWFNGFGSNLLPSLYPFVLLAMFSTCSAHQQGWCRSVEKWITVTMTVLCMYPLQQPWQGASCFRWHAGHLEFILAGGQWWVWFHAPKWLRPLCGKAIINWRLGLGTLTSTIPWTKIGTSPWTALLWIRETTPPFFLMPWMTPNGNFIYLFVLMIFFCFSLTFFVGPRSMTTSRTTFWPSYSIFKHLGRWSLKSSRTSFLSPITKCANLKWIKILLGIFLPWTTSSNSCIR